MGPEAGPADEANPLDASLSPDVQGELTTFAARNMPYRHLFFDLDHTLWDFETNSQETLQDLYLEFTLADKGVPDFQRFHQTYSVHNERLWERFRRGFISREDLRWKRLWYTLLEFKIGDRQLVYNLSDRYLELLPTKAHLFPGTLEVLDYLRGKGYPMHLITNGFEETQHLKLRHSGIADYFSHVVTSESAGCLKPQRAIFDYALQRSGCTAEEALMVGDALEIDILGARNAGMDQVYFNPAKPVRPGHRIQPTYSIGSLAELMSLL